MSASNRRNASRADRVSRIEIRAPLHRMLAGSILYVGFEAFSYVIVAAALFWLRSGFSGAWAVAVVVSCVCVSIVLSRAFGPLRRRGASLLAPGIAEIARISDAPLVVYLRSFSSDEEATAHHRALPDEHVAAIVATLGHFVALAAPSVTADLPGALRLRSEGDWIDVVSQLIERARLVIIDLTTPTAGLLKEIELLSTSRHKARVIAVFGQSADTTISEEKYREISLKFGGRFPRGLPEYRPGICCALFEQDWTPLGVGAFDRPIKTDLSFLFEELGLFVQKRGLAIGDFHLAFVAAIESVFPEFGPPDERDLPSGLRLQRLLDVVVRVPAQASLWVGIMWFLFAEVFA